MCIIVIGLAFILSIIIALQQLFGLLFPSALSSDCCEDKQYQLYFHGIVGVPQDDKTSFKPVDCD